MQMHPLTQLTQLSTQVDQLLAQLPALPLGFITLQTVNRHHITSASKATTGTLKFVHNCMLSVSGNIPAYQEEHRFPSRMCFHSQSKYVHSAAAAKKIKHYQG